MIMFKNEKFIVRKFDELYALLLIHGNLLGILNQTSYSVHFPCLWLISDLIHLCVGILFLPNKVCDFSTLLNPGTEL